VDGFVGLRHLGELQVVWAEDVLVVWGGFDNGGTWDESAQYRRRAGG
jgi:hypothetical protein